ncbi:MAG: ABC transporter ATP-binding protein [Lachnospiraceae bacterium]
MIEIENLCKSFGNKVLFDKFNLTIRDGEFIVFAGESGCGKTTLLNMIGGLEKTDSGIIRIDGKDIKERKNLKEYYLYKVGFLFQNFALVENKTVRENLEFVQKKARTDISIEEALNKVGLADKINEKIYKLSGGEQQRVAAARLLVKKCMIVLADEPTGSLDSRNGKRIMEMLHMMNEMGKTIIVVTHNENIINSERRVVQLCQ